MTSMISEPETDSSANARIGDDNVGERIRIRRKAKRMTLSDLSLQTGISTGYLSQIERGQHSPSVSTLQKVVGVLGLEMADLFTASSNAESRVRSLDAGELIIFGIGAKKLRLTPASFHSLEAFIAVLEPGTATSEASYVHGDSEELVMVLQGQAIVYIDGTEHVLREREFIHLRSNIPHRVAATNKKAEILWIITPPSY